MGIENVVDKFQGEIVMLKNTWNGDEVCCKIKKVKKMNML